MGACSKTPRVWMLCSMQFALPSKVSILPVARTPANSSGLPDSALVARASWAIPALWVFNVWGALDLLHAIYQGQFGVRIGPGSLGAAFFIPRIVALLYSSYTA
jgi:hypothetical protein